MSKEMNNFTEVSEKSMGETTLTEALGSQETMAQAVWKRFRRHPGAVAGAIMFTLIILSITLVSFSPYDPDLSDVSNRFQPPSLEHPFGTDALGRDLLTRVLYGGRISLAVSLLAVSITLIIGLPVGAIAGYFGGWVDNVLMRITDAALAFPALLMLIMLSAIVREMKVPFIERNNVFVIAFVIGILGWMTVARLVRATFLTIREMDFVTAALSMGASTTRIMLIEILPNSVGPVIVESTLEMSWAIMAEAGLSFLGFGIRPPTPSWGNLLNAAQEYLTKYPWLAIFPGIMIFLTVISINYIGDGLRDAFDPHKVIGKIE
jgi:peptide/nickel transport system permease protein